MTTIRTLYHRTGTYQKSVFFAEREDFWAYERRAAEVEHLGLNAQPLWKRSRVQLGIGAAAVDAQKCTLERVARCAA